MSFFSKTFLLRKEVFFNSFFDFFSNLFLFKVLSFRYLSLYQDFFLLLSCCYSSFPLTVTSFLVRLQIEYKSEYKSVMTIYYRQRKSTSSSLKFTHL